jgi:ABC-type amino acid transport substrate-binding protein
VGVDIDVILCHAGRLGQDRDPVTYLPIRAAQLAGAIRANGKAGARMPAMGRFFLIGGRALGRRLVLQQAW